MRRPICLGAMVSPDGMRMNDGVKQTAMCFRIKSQGLRLKLQSVESEPKGAKKAEGRTSQ